MRRLLQRLEESEMVIVTTEYTNIFISTRKEKYTTIVEEHLRKSAGYIYRGKITEIFEDAKLLVYEIGFIMSKNGAGHTNESSKTKAIPTTKLLIKCHKKLTNIGDLTTRLVIPATKLSDNSAKVGYLYLRNILEKNEIKFTRFTIFKNHT